MKWKSGDRGFRAAMDSFLEGSVGAIEVVG